MGLLIAMGGIKRDAAEHTAALSRARKRRAAMESGDASREILSEPESAGSIKSSATAFPHQRHLVKAPVSRFATSDEWARPTYDQALRTWGNDIGRHFDNRRGRLRSETS